MKTKRTIQFIAVFIILAAILTFSSCNDKEETFDDVPEELQGGWGTQFSNYYSFSVTGWTHYEELTNSFTVSELTVNKISNNHDDKATYPSGYEIMGKVKASSGTFTSSHPKGRYVTFQFFLTTDKKKISIYSYK
jgi:hypothetical protein